MKDPSGQVESFVAVPRLGRCRCATRRKLYAPSTSRSRAPSLARNRNSIARRARGKSETQVAIPTSELVSAPGCPHRRRSDVDRRAGGRATRGVALVREAEDAEVERGMVAAARGRKGKRTEYRCAACGYGIVVYERSPAARCVASHAGSMLSGGSHLLCSRILPFPWAPKASDVPPAPSLPMAEESFRYVRPGQAGASLEK